MNRHLLLLALLIMSGCSLINPFINQQKDFAKSLGVNIEDYHSPDYFPIGYFDSILKSGMTISEVHNFITGYSKVINCSGYVEIYYYFSDDENAIKIAVLYDKQGNYINMLGGSESSKFPITGCVNGLIP